MKGFISLHRKLMENAIWCDANYLKLWIYCLFKASHKEHEHLVGNQMVKLQRGQFVTGRNILADDMNRGVKPKQQLDKLTWFRYLKNLETWGMLNIKTTNKYSLVTIDKYDTYQDVFNKDEPQTEQQLNIKRTSNEQQMNTNNNVNKGNNVNKKDYTSEFEAFWNIYPRKIDKKKAFKSFNAAIKNHSLDIILAGTKKYAQAVKNTEQKFIKHAATFLNNESFVDGTDEQPQQQETPTIPNIDEKRKRRIQTLKEMRKSCLDSGSMEDVEHIDRQLRELEKNVAL